MAIARSGVLISDPPLIEFWDLDCGDKKNGFHLGGRAQFINCAAYSPDGKVVAYEDCHRSIGLMDVSSGGDAPSAEPVVS